MDGQRMDTAALGALLRRYNVEMDRPVSSNGQDTVTIENSRKHGDPGKHRGNAEALSAKVEALGMEWEVAVSALPDGMVENITFRGTLEDIEARMDILSANGLKALLDERAPAATVDPATHEAASSQGRER